jgi:hypothetical protein
MSDMFQSRLTLAAVSVTMALLAFGGAAPANPGGKDRLWTGFGGKKKELDKGRPRPPRPPAPGPGGTVEEVDADGRTLTLSASKPARQMDLTVAKGARVLLDDGTGRKDRARKGTLSDVTKGMSVALTVSGRVVTSIWVLGTTMKGELEKVDADANTLTVAVAGQVAAAGAQTFTLAKGAEVKIEGWPKGKKAPGVADLPVGAKVILRLSFDGKAVGRVLAERATAEGED